MYAQAMDATEYSYDMLSKTKWVSSQFEFCNRLQNRQMTRPSPTDDMIEAAAMAIREVAGNRSGRGRDWDRLPEAVRADYRREAMAALRAAGLTS